MDTEDFEELAIQVLAGEATLEERARFDVLLQQDAGRQAQFQEIQAAWWLVREAGPLAEAPHAPSQRIPPDRLQALMQTVRREFKLPIQEPAETAKPPFDFQRWFEPARPAWAAAILLILGGLWVFLDRTSNPNPRPDSSIPSAAYLLLKTGQVEIVRHSRSFAGRSGLALLPTDTLRVAPGAALALMSPHGLRPLTSPGAFLVADLIPSPTLAPAIPDTSTNPPPPVIQTLFLAKNEALNAAQLSTTRGGGTIPVYAPRQATASRAPTFLWKCELGKTYDLFLADELEPGRAPLRLTLAISPVDFNQVPEWKDQILAPGGLYRLIIRETGQPLSAVEHTFTVLPAGDPVDPTNSPEEKLTQAFRFLTREPVCTGDALSLLLSLPPDYGRTELALRLKLLAFGSLGLADEFHETIAQLKATVSKP
ncbi:MAG TPA: hypothetical protein P5186_27510 [Candidatus Paceibacterota bacterium]|nr:hypothetical protein [Verrucomicrobiota bacterium]HRY51802.1 hypothetical protein [Candidatus Paceibacterota bacterium]